MCRARLDLSELTFPPLHRLSGPECSSGMPSGALFRDPRRDVDVSPAEAIRRACYPRFDFAQGGVPCVVQTYSCFKIA